MRGSPDERVVAESRGLGAVEIGREPRAGSQQGRTPNPPAAPIRAKAGEAASGSGTTRSRRTATGSRPSDRAPTPSAWRANGFRAKRRALRGGARGRGASRRRRAADVEPKRAGGEVPRPEALRPRRRRSASPAGETATASAATAPSAVSSHEMRRRARAGGGGRGGAPNRRPPTHTLGRQRARVRTRRRRRETAAETPRARTPRTRRGVLQPAAPSGGRTRSGGSLRAPGQSRRRPTCRPQRGAHERGGNERRSLVATISRDVAESPDENAGSNARVRDYRRVSRTYQTFVG